MKAGAFASLGAVALLAGGAGSGRTQAARVEPPCPVDVVGLWRADDASGSHTRLEFANQGWATLHGLSPDADVPSLEVLAQVRYQLVDDTRATRIEFNTNRGNDVIPAGTTAWPVLAHDADSFTTRNAETGERIRWSRVQTHRYFVTFAAAGTGEGAGSVFAMWTAVDGRHTTTNALGLGVAGDGQAGIAGFGRVPDALMRRFAHEGDPDTDPFLRVELTTPEYHRVRDLFERIAQRPNEPAAISADPYRRTVDLLTEVVAVINQCGIVVQRNELPGAAAGEQRPQPFRLIRMLKAANPELHVPDDRFPFRWEPPPID